MADLRMRLLPLFRRHSAASTRSTGSSNASAGPDDGRTKSFPVAERVEEEAAAAATQPSPVRASLPAATQTDPSPVHPTVVLQEATPEPFHEIAAADRGPAEQRPEPQPRRQSLAQASDRRFIQTLLESHPSHPRADDYFGPSTLSASMLHRKVWVRRPGASATLVQTHEDDPVDELRDLILKKYANSLGRSYDAPDLTLRIVPRDRAHRASPPERTLGPEESIATALDAYFPGGQTVDEALLIDVPQRRTPRHSPRATLPYWLPGDDIRPVETDREYFPILPPGVAIPSPHLASGASAAGSQASGSLHHSISVLNTGQVPPLPSPGGRSARHGYRPRTGRNTTLSPTALATSGAQQHGKCGGRDG